MTLNDPFPSSGSNAYKDNSRKDYGGGDNKGKGKGKSGGSAGKPKGDYKQGESLTVTSAPTSPAHPQPGGVGLLPQDGGNGAALEDTVQAVHGPVHQPSFHLAREYISLGTDAFAVPSWKDFSYAFPLHPLLSKCLAKIQAQRIAAILVAPMWTVNPGWDVMGSLRVSDHILLGKAVEVCLLLPGRKVHRFDKLVACLVWVQGPLHQPSWPKTS